MKIIENTDCGNSPKNIFVQSLEIAISMSDTEFMKQSTTGNLEWTIAGNGKFTGHSSIPAAMKALKLICADKLTIKYVLSHGKTGASLSLRSRKQNEIQYINNFFQFSSAKGNQVSRITTMVL